MITTPAIASAPMMITTRVIAVVFPISNAAIAVACGDDSYDSEVEFVC